MENGVIGIDELDFDDEVLDQNSTETQENPDEQESHWVDYSQGENYQDPSYQSAEEPSGSEPDDLIANLLRQQGIRNPDEIKFEDDNGQIVNRRWSDLTQEEQFNILNTPQIQEVESDLDDSEIDLINRLR